jgi:ribulose-5-phosphate 4-epimerase/fuculose-1-phosphate aldolase
MWNRANIYLTGENVPVFDIAPLYKPGEQQDMLVNNTRFGEALASEFVDRAAPASGKDLTPAHNVVLMRRHGYTTHGTDIETAVYRAIYTKINAGVQTSATNIRHNFPHISNLQHKFDFEPLTAEQCRGCIIMNEGTQDKPWRLWVQEVEKSHLYTNNG